MTRRRGGATVEIVSRSQLQSAFRTLGLPLGCPTTKNEEELWLAIRFISTLSVVRSWSWPVKLTHNDAPDFQVEDSTGRWSIEVTEATCPADRRETATMAPGVVETFGQRGGRAITGLSPEAIPQFCSDVAKAVNSKAIRSYATKSCALCIYANGHPGVFIDPTVTTAALRLTQIDAITKFKEVLVILNVGAIWWDGCEWQQVALFEQ